MGKNSNSVTVTRAVHANHRKRYNSTHWQFSLMTLPGVLHLLIFAYLPMCGIIIAVKDYRFNLGIFGSKWNGVENFKFLFRSNTLYTILRNTFGYNLVIMFLGIVCAVVVALLLEQVSTKKTAIKLFQSSMFLPYFLSWIVVSYISLALLDYDSGIFNHIRNFFGQERISFYSEKAYWPFILVSIAIWKSVGYNSLIYYGSILGIDTSLNEAAYIDGCNYFKRVWHVTLPQLRRSIIILTLLGIGGMFRSDYGLYFFIPRDTGALYSVTDVLDTYIIRSIRNSTNMGLASAMGFMQSVAGFILIVAANKIVNKLDRESALF